jgi:hypothetical protein
LRIIGADFRFRHAVQDHPTDMTNRQARSSENRLAAEHVRSALDALETAPIQSDAVVRCSPEDGDLFAGQFQ